MARFITTTPTPDPSPQGGGEQTEFAAHSASLQRLALQTRPAWELLQFRQDVFAEEFDGAHGVGGEAHREHEPLGAGRLGGARLRETIVRIAADRQPPREIVEQAELLHELDVGFARPRAVAGMQFEELETQRLGLAAPLRMLVADHVAGEESEHGADLGTCDVAVLATLERRDLPNLEVVDGATGSFRAGDEVHARFADVVGGEPVIGTRRRRCAPPPAAVWDGRRRERPAARA